MCIIVNSVEPLVAKTDIHCWKYLVEREDGRLVTPIVKSPVELGQTMIPEKRHKGPKPKGANLGGAYLYRNQEVIGLILNPSREDFFTRLPGIRLVQATIPKGTKFLVDCWLWSMCAEKVILGNELLPPGTRVEPDYSFLLDYYEPVREEGFGRMYLKKNNQKFGFYRLPHQTNLYGKGGPSETDGKKNTEGLLGPIASLAAIEGGYIPAIKQLQDLYSELTEINVTRVLNGQAAIHGNLISSTAATLSHGHFMKAPGSNVIREGDQVVVFFD